MSDWFIFADQYGNLFLKGLRGVWELPEEVVDEIIAPRGKRPPSVATLEALSQAVPAKVLNTLTVKDLNTIRGLTNKLQRDDDGYFLTKNAPTEPEYEDLSCPCGQKLTKLGNLYNCKASHKLRMGIRKLQLRPFFIGYVWAKVAHTSDARLKKGAVFGWLNGEWHPLR